MNLPNFHMVIREFTALYDCNLLICAKFEANTVVNTKSQKWREKQKNGVKENPENRWRE